MEGRYEVEAVFVWQKWILSIHTAGVSSCIWFHCAAVNVLTHDGRKKRGRQEEEGMLSAILFTFQKAWRSPLPNSIFDCGAFVSSLQNHKPFIYFKETVVISLLAGVQ